MSEPLPNCLHSPQRLRTKVCLAFTLALSIGASAAESLSEGDVHRILAQASAYAKLASPKSVVAVVDREGFVLGVLNAASRNDLTPGLTAGAVSRAGTAAFLSSNENAFTSRTAGYIIQQHFPPGVRNSPPGPLVGVGFSNLFFSDSNRFKQIPTTGVPNALITNFTSPGARTPAVPLTSLADSPGGIPLYKNGELVGGVGVTGDASPSDLSPAAFLLNNAPPATSTAGFKVAADTDEAVALAAQSGFRPSHTILATNVLLGGIRAPYVVANMARLPEPPQTLPLDTAGKLTPAAGSIATDQATPALTYTPQASPAKYPYPATSLGGVAGEVRHEIRADPLSSTPINGQPRLTKAEVEGILTLAAQRCSIVRAGIRLPVGTRAKVFISVVNNPNQAGVAPEILGVFRVGEATMFSWDVSVQKARTAVFFSSKQMAMSCRAVGFLAQRFFPPGLDGRPWGPLFGLQEAASLKTTSAGAFPGNPNLPNGMTIFPGGFPLYRNGEIIGAIGVSGDGVDQDDIISASGCANFLAPEAIKADQFTYKGARLPYAKFPRSPQE